jgi:hypothetical protein
LAHLNHARGVAEIESGAAVRGSGKGGTGYFGASRQEYSAKGSWPLLHLRVMMPDGSDCIFNGRPKGNAIEGSYLCLQGGGLIERGIRRAGRNY